MIGGLIYFLVGCLILCVVLYVVNLVLGMIDLPANIKQIGLVIIGLIGFLVLIALALGAFRGGGLGF